MERGFLTVRSHSLRSREISDSIFERRNSSMHFSKFFCVRSLSCGVRRLTISFHVFSIIMSKEYRNYSKARLSFENTQSYDKIIETGKEIKNIFDFPQIEDFEFGGRFQAVWFTGIKGDVKGDILVFFDIVRIILCGHDLRKSIGC